MLPMVFSIQLLTGGRLQSVSSALIVIGLLSAVVLSLQFFVINYNTTKMEKRTARLKLAREIKRYLLQENYYWLYKHFVIFDVDRKLNIYLIFMLRAAIAQRHDVTVDRCRRILRENNLLVDVM